MANVTVPKPSQKSKERHVAHEASVAAKAAAEKAARIAAHPVASALMEVSNVFRSLDGSHVAYRGGADHLERMADIASRSAPHSAAKPTEVK